MNYLTQQIVFRELPNEISLSYLITGCNLRCPGCHSVDSWNPAAGRLLTDLELRTTLDAYKNWITCVLFMGGEWYHEELLAFLVTIQKMGFKTALYSGQEHVPESVLQHLDYIKLGPYRQERGGLGSPTTNQKLIDVKTGQILNSPQPQTQPQPQQQSRHHNPQPPK